MMRSAGFGATAVIAGCAPASPPDAAPQVSAQPVPPPTSKVSRELAVVKKAKVAVMTTLDEVYKVGPGPSSSHTIGQSHRG